MSKARTTPIETIGPGDLAAFTFKDGDITHTTYGTVAEIEYVGHMRVLLSSEGKELARYTVNNPRAVSVMLEARYLPRQPDLLTQLGNWNDDLTSVP